MLLGMFSKYIYYILIYIKTISFKMYTLNLYIHITINVNGNITVMISFVGFSMFVKKKTNKHSHTRMGW